MNEEQCQSQTSVRSRSESRKVGTVPTSSNPMQMVIQRLQSECEMLRAEKRDIERRTQFDFAKLNRVITENQETQRHLLVENQKLLSENQHLKSRMREYGSALELANDRIKQVDNIERQTSMRCEVLEETVRELEALSERQRNSLEYLEQEIEKLNEILVTIGDERDQVVEHTEADAKRVRILWEETLSQHKAELSVLQKEIESGKKDQEKLESSLAMKNSELTEVRMKLSQCSIVASRDAQRIQALELHVAELKENFNRAQDQHSHASESLQTVALQVEEQATKLRNTEELLFESKKLQEDFQREAQSSKEELENVLLELDVLKSEFAAALEEHEKAMEGLQSHIRKTSQVEKKLEVELEAEKRYALSMAGLLGNQIGDYTRVLSTVEQTLAQLQPNADVDRSSAQPIRAPRKAREDSSLSIFAH